MELSKGRTRMCAMAELRSCQFAIPGQNPVRALASSIGNGAACWSFKSGLLWAIFPFCSVSRVAGMAMASLDMSRVAVHRAQRTPFKSMQVALWFTLRLHTAAKQHLLAFGIHMPKVKS